jgi:hypothetical protein
MNENLLTAETLLNHFAKYCFDNFCRYYHNGIGISCCGEIMSGKSGSFLGGSGYINPHLNCMIHTFLNFMPVAKIAG